MFILGFFRWSHTTLSLLIGLGEKRNRFGGDTLHGITNLLVMAEWPIISGGAWTSQRYHDPSVRRWRHLPARRTDGSSGWRDSVDVFVLVAFCVDFRDATPRFDTSITPECRDPAKMKWMFKEDHSLGKRLRVVMKQHISSCRAPFLSVCFPPRRFCRITH